MQESPFVSVIVPVKERRGTIRKLVESYLEQDYTGESELILVGDIGDTTWLAIDDYIARNQVRVIEAEVSSAGRDANAKRNVGLAAAQGDILALTDSDVLLPVDWISGIIERIRTTGLQVVAGSLYSVRQGGFWSDYIDKNPLGNKTPRMNPPYVLTKLNCGKPGYKQPITANLAFTREVYDVVGGTDADFVTPYEDYPYSDMIVAAGFDIFCDGSLKALHYHRDSFRTLSGEYRKAGFGCADYVLRYPSTRLAVLRARQVAVVFLMSLVMLLSVVAYPVISSLAVATAYALASIVIWRKLLSIRAALFFPITTVWLAGLFVIGMTMGFVSRYWSDQPLTSIVAIREKNGAYERKGLSK